MGTMGVATSDLNPNAPLYVPWAYRKVEDFSEQWWELVKGLPWYRDYWVQEYCSEEVGLEDLLDDVLDDADTLFHDYELPGEEVRGKGSKEWRKDVALLGADRWHGLKGATMGTRYAEKAPKIVNVRVNPRPIKQPR